MPAAKSAPIRTFPIVLNGPERAPKSPRNGPSSTYDSGNVLDGPKQDQNHAPQTAPTPRARPSIVSNEPNRAENTASMSTAWLDQLFIIPGSRVLPLPPQPHRRQTTPAPGIPRTGVGQSRMQFLQAGPRRPTSLAQPYACVSSLPSTRPSVMAIPMVRPLIAVEYSMAKRPPELLPVAYRLTIGL